MTRFGKDQDVAGLMGLSKDRLQKRIHEGLPTPPYIMLPGAKSRLWNLDLAEAWVEQYTVGGDNNVDVPRSVPRELAKRKRGRPRKTKRSFELS